MKKILTNNGSKLILNTAVRKSLPPIMDNADSYTQFWEARTEHSNEVMFYLGKGHPEGPRQIVVWYRNGQMWHSFGATLESAIEGAVKDAWTDGTRN